MKNEAITSEAIEKGLEFLYLRQLPSGSFDSYCTESVGCENDAMIPIEGETYHSSITRDVGLVFPSLLIGSSLLPIAGHIRADRILVKIKDFVKNHRDLGGTWHYCQRNHPYYRLIPNDIDDTAYALAFLKGMGEKVEKSPGILLNHRRKDGLYYTFFTARREWNPSVLYWITCRREIRYPIQNIFFWRAKMIDRYDVAMGVNANVLYFLGKRSETEPVIKALIEIILTGKESSCDTYYRNPFTIYYQISRNYREGIRELAPVIEPITHRILEKRRGDGSFNGNAHDTAHAINTLLDFEYHEEILDKAVEYLVKNQSCDGSWPRRIYYSGSYGNIIAGWGGEEMTTSLCIEAIHRYKNEPKAKNRL